MALSEFVPSEDEIKDYLFSLVDRGVLEMGFQDGDACFWLTDKGARTFEIADALYGLLGLRPDPTTPIQRDLPHGEPLQTA